jgi:toxoflavin biosynthesis protein ToxD
MTFLPVPAGRYRIGTTWSGVEKCVEQWKHRLINPCYQEVQFREWIAKEFPAHVVKSESFELQRCPVTNADAAKFVAATGAEVPESLAVSGGGQPNHPVWGVSLQWARSYAEWLSQGTACRHRYRLPTEMEWEIAARGMDFREYPYGGEFNSRMANTQETGIGATTPVDHFSHSPGPFGHLDLAGNVEEWVDSRYSVYPGGHPITDDLYERFGMNYFILRGGSFACGGDLSRSARRHGPFPDPLFRYTGFRLVRE